MKPTRRPPRQFTTTQSRRGGALVIMMVLLFATSIILMGLVQQVLRQQRQLQQETRQVQAQWCTEAGLQRALARLSSAPDYTGEVWTSAIADDQGAPTEAVSAEVTITVQPDGPRRRITVLTEYPLGAPHRVRLRRELWQALPSLPATATPTSALKPENLLP